MVLYKTAYDSKQPQEQLQLYTYILVFLVAKQLYEAPMSVFLSVCLFFCLSVCNHFLKNASFTQDNHGGVKVS